MIKPKLEVFGCWLPPQFAQMKLGYPDWVYMITAKDDCEDRHSLQLLVTKLDMDKAHIIPWDSMYNKIYNEFIDIHKKRP